MCGLFSCAPTSLTDSLSLSLLLVVVSFWLFTWQNIGNWKYWVFLCGGSLIVGFCVMVRPANIFMLAAWFAGQLQLVFGDNAITFRKRVRSALVTAPVTVALALIPMLPQLRNNVVYYGRWTPLVADDLQRRMQTVGVLFIKYATGISPAPVVSVTYPNPLFAGTHLPAPNPGVWYLEHPVRGAATVGLHVFNLIDQDFPFVYVRNLLPWYRLPEAIALQFLVGLSLLGLFAWFREFSTRKPGEIGPAITMRAAFLFSVGAYLAVYGTSDPESRFGVPLLWALLPFSFIAVQRLRAVGGKSRWVNVASVLAYAALAVCLSMWVTAQSPAIAMARRIANGASANLMRIDYGPLSIAPKAGSGRDQVFRVSLARTPGAQPPAMIGLLINDRIDGGNACYVFWDFASDDALLVNDNGSGSQPLGTASSAANGQCELLRSGSLSSLTSSEMTAQFHLRLRKTFAGPRQLYVISQAPDGTGPGLVQAGTWTVP